MKTLAGWLQPARSDKLARASQSQAQLIAMLMGAGRMKRELAEARTGPDLLKNFAEQMRRTWSVPPIRGLLKVSVNNEYA